MNDPNKLIQGVLVSFSYGNVAGSKKNVAITQEVCDDKHADSDAGTWSDKLFPAKSCGKKNSFTSLRKHLGAMRAWHYQNSYVFEDSLWRILPEKRIEAYKQVIETDGKTTALKLLEAFVNDLPNLIDLARLGRAEAFNESDYPTVEEIRAKFRYAVDYRPIPTGAGLNPTVMQEAIDKLNALHTQRLKEANAALVTRFLEPFQLLSEQLKDPTKRKMAPVLDRIREFSQIIPSLDLSGNTELLELAQTINLTFADITPDVLKADEEMAKFVGQTATGVVEALSRFGNLGQRKFAA